MEKVEAGPLEPTPAGESPVNFGGGEGEHVRGFSVRRRSLLWLPVLTASALLFGHTKGASARQGPGAEKSSGAEPPKAGGGSAPGELAWADFIERSVPEARALYKDASPHGQDIYLYTLAQWVARLRLETIPRAKVFRFGELTPPVLFGVGYKGVPFVLVEWRLEPGAFLPPHNHPNASVCTLGIEGEAFVRNFQVVGEAPDFSSKDVFRVQETHSEVMSAGRINVLSSARDNIHTFRAGKAGARGIDFGTLHGKELGFSFLDIAGSPADPERRIYQATWKNLS
jgi:hypothetical protein